MIESPLHKGTDRYYFWAKVDLAKGLLDKQFAFNGTLLEVNNKIQQRSHLGRHATLCRDELTECQQKFAYSCLHKAREIYRRVRRRYISLWLWYLIVNLCFMYLFINKE